MPREENKTALMSLDEAENLVSTKELPEGFWKFLISSFIAIYFCSVFIWIFNEIPFRSHFTDLSKKINIVDGATQHWSLFSPDVRHVIFYETATITFKDGSLKYYEFPRMAELDYTEKFVHEKLRKVFSDCIPWTGYEHFLVNITQYLAAANQDSKNPPTVISMINHWTTNPPPDPANWSYRDKPPRHVQTTITFVYAVREKDLAPRTAQDNPEQTNPRVFDAK